MLAHLTIAGAAEAILTGGVFAYLARANPQRLSATHRGIEVEDAQPRDKRRILTPGRVAVGFVALMVILTPLGLLAPGGAFGEDAPGDLSLGELGLRAVPTGLAKYSGFWSHALLGGYGFHDGQHANLGYLLSALVGIAVTGAVIFLLGLLVRAIVRKTGSDKPDVLDAGEPSRS
jgi:cobalt/nickel transport system permease protein